MPKRLAPSDRAALSAAIVDLFGDSGERVPPTEFRIFPKGVVASTKGEFLFDDDAAAAVMSEAIEHGVDLTIDYDHHTLHVANGVKAISAGWFGLALRDDGLWATNVRWTPVAEQHLRTSEYRYFSPLFDWDKKSGRITNLINNALTNTPAMHGLEALVAASANATDHLEDEVDPKLKEALDRIADLERANNAKDETIKRLEGQTATAALSSTVGLAANAGHDEIRTRVTSLATFRKQALAIAGKDSDGEALGVLTAMKEQAAEVVGLRDKAEKAETAALSAEFNAHLDALTTTGHEGKFLPPAAREKAEAMGKELGGGKFTKDGIEKAKAYLSLMLVSAPGAGDSGDKSKTSKVSLSATEIEIAERTGTDPEKVRKYKEKRLTGGAS